MDNLAKFGFAGSPGLVHIPVQFPAIPLFSRWHHIDFDSREEN